MLLHALQIEADNVSGIPFDDIDDRYLISSYFKYFIVGNNTLNVKYYYPGDNATRAEAVSTSVRAIDYKDDPKA